MIKYFSRLPLYSKLILIGGFNFSPFVALALVHTFESGVPVLGKQFLMLSAFCSLVALALLLLYAITTRRRIQYMIDAIENYGNYVLLN